MKYSVSIFISLFFQTILAYSRNQSISEWGIALKYNTHILDYNPDDPTAGTPVLNGYLFVLGTNDTTNPDYDASAGEEEIRVHPEWTTTNSLRVCM